MVMFACLDLVQTMRYSSPLVDVARLKDEQ